jgi:hypothetical protein
LPVGEAKIFGFSGGSFYALAVPAVKKEGARGRMNPKTDFQKKDKSSHVYTLSLIKKIPKFFK